MIFKRFMGRPKENILRTFWDRCVLFLTGTPSVKYQLAIVKPKTAKVRLLAFISYLSILCLVPLLIARDDEFVQFHARQGLVLWLWGLLCLMALHLPGLGPFISGISVLFIGFFSLLGMLSVLFSRRWKLPWIGGLAAKL